MKKLLVFGLLFSSSLARNLGISTQDSLQINVNGTTIGCGVSGQGSSACIGIDGSKIGGGVSGQGPSGQQSEKDAPFYYILPIGPFGQNGRRRRDIGKIGGGVSGQGPSGQGSNQDAPIYYHGFPEQNGRRRRSVGISTQDSVHIGIHGSKIECGVSGQGPSGCIGVHGSEIVGGVSGQGPSGQGSKQDAPIYYHGFSEQNGRRRRSIGISTKDLIQIAIVGSELGCGLSGQGPSGCIGVNGSVIGGGVSGHGPSGQESKQGAPGYYIESGLGDGILRSSSPGSNRRLL